MFRKYIFLSLEQKVAFYLFEAIRMIIFYIYSWTNVTFDHQRCSNVCYFWQRSRHVPTTWIILKWSSGSTCVWVCLSHRLFPSFLWPKNTLKWLRKWCSAVFIRSTYTRLKMPLRSIGAISRSQGAKIFVLHWPT